MYVSSIYWNAFHHVHHQGSWLEVRHQITTRAHSSRTDRVRDPKNESGSPDAVVLSNDLAQCLYCHLLCAHSDSTHLLNLLNGRTLVLFHSTAQKWSEHHFYQQLGHWTNNTCSIFCNNLQ
jgi:hypothetical protein